MKEYQGAKLVEKVRAAGSRKVVTAKYVLSKQGVGAFLQKSISTLRSYLHQRDPDESRIAYRALQAHQKAGVMVDVGAQYGGAAAPFADSGWQVYAFEPDALNRKRLTSSFGHYENVIIDPRAVSNKNQRNVGFYTSEISAGISSLLAFHPTHVRVGTVDTTTLDSFFREHRIDTVDLLKVDAEGLDLLILQGLPWDRVAPRLITCEFEDSKTALLDYCFHDLAEFLQQRGYNVLVSEWFPVVRYGGPHSWRRFATYPCELQDRNAWGNLLAAKGTGLFGKILHEAESAERKARPKLKK